MKGTTKPGSEYGEAHRQFNNRIHHGLYARLERLRDRWGLSWPKVLERLATIAEAFEKKRRGK